MANPQVRPHMNFLPHVDGKRMSQAWHGYKMVHDIDDKYLTPCIHVNGRIFYINELVQRKSDWFIPLRWITHGPSRELRAIGHIANQTEVSDLNLSYRLSRLICPYKSGLSVQHTKRITVRVSTFLASFPELQVSNAVPRFNGAVTQIYCSSCLSTNILARITKYRRVQVVRMQDAKSTARAGRIAYGLLYPTHHIYGRRIRQYLKAVE